MKQTLKEIKQKLSNIDNLKDPFLNNLKNDPRVGVQKLLAQKINQLSKIKLLKENFIQRQQIERQARQMGYKHIVGIDEVGRGPLAGPVVTCAVELPEKFSLYEVNDSKQLSAYKREKLFNQIKRNCVDYSIASASVEEIDRLNIYEATRISMKRAVEQLKIKPDLLLIDDMQIEVDIDQKSFIKGDAKSISIGAASILAKVYRDHLMQQYSVKYPEYHFDKNNGYGTQEHIEALKKYGVTPIHRQSFSPVQKCLN